MPHRTDGLREMESAATDLPKHRDNEPTTQIAIFSGVYILQAARMVGTSTASIRMWEKHGLVSPERTASGYRIYSMAEVSRLRQIHRLTLEGVNPAGILRILQSGSETSGSAPAVHDEDHPAHSVGETLKQLRSTSRLTLRQVAKLTGLSASYISSVERSLAAPSLASLQKLAVAFGTNVQGLMGQATGAPDTVLVRPSQRRVLDSGDGVTIEDMSTASSNLESLLFTVLPGAGSAGAFSHEGEEMLYIVTGELDLTLDGTDEYHLEVGDSMSYDSPRPHAWVNRGSETTVIVWVNTPRTF